MEEVWSSVHNTGPKSSLTAQDNRTEMSTVPDCRRAAFAALLTGVTSPLPYYRNESTS